MMSDKRSPFFLALAVLAFSPLIEGGTTFLPVFIIRVLILLQFCVHIAACLKNGSLDFRRTSLDRAVLAFLAAAVVSVFIAPYKNMAFTWVQIVLYYVLFFYLTAAAIYSGGAELIAVKAVMAMGAVEAAWECGQWLHGTGRPSGSFFNPNMLAGYLVPALLVAVSLVVFRHRMAVGRARKAALIFFSCLMALAIIMTGSRGALVSLGAGLFLVLWVRSKRLAVASIILAAAALLLVPNPVRERLYSNDIFAYSRADIWASTLRMVKDHPMGVGLGNYKYMAAAYNFPVEEAVIKYGRIANTAHNEYLQVGAEMGILGLAAFLYGVYLVAGSVRMSMRGDDGTRGIAAGVSGGIAAILVHGLFDSNFHEPGIFLLLIFLVCILLKVASSSTKPVSLPLNIRSGARLYILAACLAAFLLLWAGAAPLAYYYSVRSIGEVSEGNAAQPLKSIDKSLLFDPGNASYHNQRASLLYRVYKAGGDKEYLKESIRELDEAKRLNPTEAGYPLMKARILYWEGTSLPGAPGMTAMKAALEEALASLRQNPYNFECFMLIARINAGLGDTGAAVSALERLEAIEPNYLNGRLFLAGLYLRAGRRDLSSKEYDNIIKIQKKLAARPMDKVEADFVKLDPREMERLRKVLET